MVVKEAYRDRTHSVCRDHYAHPPIDAPTLGPVQDARDNQPCEFCPEERYADGEGSAHDPWCTFPATRSYCD